MNETQKKIASNGIAIGCSMIISTITAIGLVRFSKGDYLAAFISGVIVAVIMVIMAVMFVKKRLYKLRDEREASIQEKNALGTLVVYACLSIIAGTTLYLIGSKNNDAEIKKLANFVNVNLFILMGIYMVLDFINRIRFGDLVKK